MTAWDIVPEEKAMFFSSSQGRKCSQYGVHKGMCVCIHEDLSKSMNMFICSKNCIWFAYVHGMQKINEDVGRICPLDVQSLSLGHFLMFHKVV